MPRIARTIVSGIPHHVTQRGNRRETVFFTAEDRRTYLAWLREYAFAHDVEILAYCLMTNHVHLVAVPADEHGLQNMLRPLHMRYAQRVNRAQGWTGHVWQGRFFSSVLDENYLWAAMRYVERNPVRAGMAPQAEDYPWSSAQAHCGLFCDMALTRSRRWNELFGRIDDWSAWLAEDDQPKSMTVLRRNANKNLPCGTNEFISTLEKRTGRVLRYRPRGRPKKKKEEGENG